MMEMTLHISPGEIKRPRRRGEFNYIVLPDGKEAPQGVKALLARYLMNGKIDRVDSSIEEARARLAPYVDDPIEAILKEAYERKHPNPKDAPPLNKDCLRRGGAAWKVAEGLLRKEIGGLLPNRHLVPLIEDAKSRNGDDAGNTPPPWRFIVQHQDEPIRDDIVESLVGQWAGPGLKSNRLQVRVATGIKSIPSECDQFKGRIIVLTEMRDPALGKIMRKEELKEVEWFFLDSHITSEVGTEIIDTMLERRAVSAAVAPRTGLGIDLEIMARELYDRFIFDDEADRVLVMSMEISRAMGREEWATGLRSLGNALLRESPSQWANLKSFHARFNTWSREVLLSRL